MARGFRRFERPPWWAVAVMAVSAAWLVIGGAFLSHAHDAPTSTAETNRLAARESAAEAREAAASVVPSVAVLGDSYTAESNDGKSGYLPTLGRLLNWNVKPFAQGGTGYVNPGQAEQHESNYINRVPDVVAAKPDIVIVEGGGNDVSGASCDIQKPAAQVFAALRTALPKAKIVAVTSVAGPQSTGGPVVFEKCAAAISAAAQPLGIPVIDPIALHWFSDSDPTLFVDGVHLTQPSFDKYAHLLADRLRLLGTA